MTDGAALEKMCVDGVQSAGLLDVGRLFYTFENGGGVTGTVVLAESHLCVHTWPEHNYATLDVFVCNHTADNTKKAHTLANALIDRFAPHRKTVREIAR